MKPAAGIKPAAGPPQLTVTGAQCNWHTWLRDIKAEAQALTDTGLVLYLTSLMDDNARPVPVGKTEAQLNDLKVAMAAAVDVPQNVDPLAPGYIQGATDALIRTEIANQRGRLEAAAIAEASRNSDYVFKRALEFSGYCTQTFGWLKARISDGVWMALASDEAFNLAVRRSDGAALWLVLHGKYRLGTNGSPGLSDEAKLELEIRLGSLTMRAGEPLGDFMYRFHTEML